jgi:hypothetical protein
MSRSTLMSRALHSLDDAKIVAVQLRNALEEVGVSVPRAKLLQVVARLCGANQFDDLNYRFKGKSAPVLSTASAPNAQMRLLTLPEVLLLKKTEDEGPLAEHLEFFDKVSTTRWCYAMTSQAIKPAALEAARRLVLGEKLRPTDTAWLTGSLRELSIIDDPTADGALNINTQSLARAAYLGEGKWSLGSNYYCRVSVNDPVLIERSKVPVSAKSSGEERLCAQLFAPPHDFAAAGFEAFTFNIEFRLMLRCLALPHAAAMLEALHLVAPATSPLRLRLALLRTDADGRTRIIRVLGRAEPLLTGLSWDGTMSTGEREQRGSTPPDVGYSGEAGLARIWQEIREWAASDPSAASIATESSADISAIRRAQLEQWVRK